MPMPNSDTDSSNTRDVNPGLENSGSVVGAGETSDYREQTHAGKVGYGPNYKSGPSFGTKLEGVKDIMKGKVTKNPELVEEGHLKKTGELDARKQAEEDANDVSDCSSRLGSPF